MASVTNDEIITRARLDLMRDGKIGTTGRVLTIALADGTEQSFPEPEQIHTYQHWKSLGYQVRKGERAVADLMIWKYSQRKTKTVESDETDDPTSGKLGRCFMKRAYFFSAGQVEKMKRDVA